MSETITIRVRRIETFDALFKRLCRKARRLHLIEPTYQKTGEAMEKCDIFQVNEMGNPVKIDTVDLMVSTIEITGTHPVTLDGWSFAASVEHTPKGNLIFPIPGLEVPAKFSEANCSCEHCNLSRFRKGLFLVRNVKTEEWKQVGSTCLQDFVGGASAEALARQFEFFGEITQALVDFDQAQCFGFEGTAAAYELREIVARGLAVQAKHGWLSKTKAREQGGSAIPTAERVLETYKNHQAMTELEVTEKMLEEADLYIETFAALNSEEVAESDFARNLKVICSAGYASKTSFGLACALPVAYKVRQDKAAREATQELRRQASKHVGEAGKRQNFTATIERIIILESELYGPKTLTIMADDSGNVLVGGSFSYKNWNSETHRCAEEGDRVTFKATVKEHGERDGVKQTKLLRAAMVTNHTLEQETVPQDQVAI